MTTMTIRMRLPSVLVALICLAGCGSEVTTSSTDGMASNSASTAGNKGSATDGAETASLASPGSLDITVLLDPKNEKLNQTAPEAFKARFQTSKGDFVVKVTRSWSPHGADRFYNLVSNGYYNDCRFFRVVGGFMAQFGMHGDPKVTAAWNRQNIPDDKVVKSNTRGTITYAKTNNPNSRTTQLFINYGDNSNLNRMGFSPFGQVIEGLTVVDSLYSGYGDAPPGGIGPDQALIREQGTPYLQKYFPKLDYIKTARIIE